MHTRLSRAAALVAAAALFAACNSPATSPAGGSTAVPGGVATAAPGASIVGDAMTTFCQAWAADVAPSWPPDAATAARLAPILADWATAPELATVGVDLTAVAAWLTTQAGSTSMTVPDAATTAAFARIGAFVAANC